MFPVYGVDDAHPGARASRPHNAWHSPGHLRRSDRHGTAPWVSLVLTVEVHADPVAACSITFKFSGSQRHKDAGGTPAFPGVTPRINCSLCFRSRPNKLVVGG